MVAVLISSNALIEIRGLRTSKPNLYGPGTLDPNMPSEPFAKSAFWAELGLPLEAYRLLNTTLIDEAVIRDQIHDFVQPAIDYQHSLLDGWAVGEFTGDQRKASLLSLLDFLRDENSFNIDEIDDVLWNKLQIRNYITSRQTVQGVLKMRNDLIRTIEDGERKQLIKDQCQRTLSWHREQLEQLSYDGMERLISRRISAEGWEDFKAIYKTILREILSVVPARMAGNVRFYLSMYLYTGNKHDLAFETLRKKSATYINQTHSASLK